MTTMVADTLVEPAVAEPAATEFAVARSLARIEGRRLLLSPLVLVAFGLALLMQGRPGPWITSVHEDAANSGFLYLLPAAMTLVAANLAALRGRRHGAEELFATTPASARARTGAHLLAVAWPAVASTLVIVLFLANSGSYGAVELVQLADLAVGPLLVAGAGALGVMLARWAPTPAAGPLACVAIAALELFLTSPAVLTTGWRYMAFWVDAGDQALLPPRPSLWHLVYLIALVAMAVVGALLRHGLRPRLAVAGAVALAVMGTSAVAQSRYVTAAAWARSDELITRPQNHQVCDRKNGIRYCTFPAYRPLADRWAPVVEGVRARVPADARPAAFEVSQRIAGRDLQYTPSELRDRIPSLPALPSAGVPVPDDGAVHPGRGWSRDGMAELSLAVGVASRVVDLPLAPAAPGTVCDTAGQSRAVVALWLAAQAVPRTGAALAGLTQTNVLRLGSDSLPPHLLVPNDPVQPAAVWGMVEVRHALALARRPAAEVEAALGSDWARFTDPATTTAELASALSLDPVPESELRPAWSPNQDPAAPPELRLDGPCGS